jgi:amino acid permease
MTCPTIDRVENLVPSYDSPERISTSVVASFNLVATIVGGGILSLPLAFEKCGIGLGTLLVLLASVVTNISLYLLCQCARYTGATTYVRT